MKNHKEQEGDLMKINIETKRPCLVSDSIIESFKEVKEMREGKTPKRSLGELFSNIEDWRKE